MGAQQVYWPAAKVLLTPSSGFTQGDVNSSKLFTCNTASLVAGLQAASPLAADLLLIDVALKEPGRDGQTVAIDFSVVSPAAESYCKQSAKEPLYAAGNEDFKICPCLQGNGQHLL